MQHMSKIRDLTVQQRLARILVSVKAVELDLTELSFLESITLLKGETADPLIEPRRAEILQSQAQLALFHYCLINPHRQQKNLQQKQQQQKQQQLTALQHGHIFPINSPMSPASNPLLLAQGLTSNFPAMGARLDTGCGPINCTGLCNVTVGHVEESSGRLSKLLLLLQLLSSVTAADMEREIFPDLNVKGLIRSLLTGTCA
ncbi:hypothetical protein PoB_001606000 [Plakobranchus ocellatus]|uniref:NR LBD domain-containing protein n=1 Tax=Plakobranchus ocellatus TaxID=259542 RepID=A0AAV3Z2D4_9GAST|nr:hypothetical protein PoB_001606000 [Plakobranchus ocellatus]